MGVLQAGLKVASCTKALSKLKVLKLLNFNQYSYLDDMSLS